MIRILLEYKKHLSKLEEEIDALAKDIEEYKIIKSIPGIGEKIAATIISEIGEIDRFHYPKKLVTFGELTLAYLNLVPLKVQNIASRKGGQAG